MNKSRKYSSVNNVQLVSEQDPFYQLYMSRHKSEKMSDVVYDKPVRKKANIMGYLLELTVRHWVSGLPSFIEEKIISFREGSNERQEPRWRELDYVLKAGNRYTIGEVKVSLREKNISNDAFEQVSNSREILSQISNSVNMQIIKIDLNFKNATEPFDKFHNDFKNVKFRTYEWEGLKFQILYLSAKDVFDYGVARGIIKSPEIFEPIIYEMDLKHERRQIKEKLKNKKKELLEISNVDALEAIQNDIDSLRKQLFPLEVKINLSEQGWSHITNRNQDDYNLIVDDLGQNIGLNNQTNYCTKTNGFSSDHPMAKFVSFYNSSGKGIEFSLLDAELVYIRLLDGQQRELQKIEFLADDINMEGTGSSYPLFSKFPH